LMATFPDNFLMPAVLMYNKYQMAGPACALTMQGPGRGLVASEGVHEQCRVRLDLDLSS